MRKTLAAIPGVLEAVIDGVAADGRPVVVWEDGPPQGAPATPIWTPTVIDWSACGGIRALVAFMEGDQEQPVLLGLLDAPPADALRAPAPGASPRAEESPRILRIEGQEEVVIECGKSKIQLRADGTVVVLGERILSRSKGVNRIKGGAVQIN